MNSRAIFEKLILTGFKDTFQKPGLCNYNWGLTQYFLSHLIFTCFYVFINLITSYCRQDFPRRVAETRPLRVWKPYQKERRFFQSSKINVILRKPSDCPGLGHMAISVARTFPRTEIERPDAQVQLAITVHCKWKVRFVPLV